MINRDEGTGWCVRTLTGDSIDTSRETRVQKDGYAKKPIIALFTAVKFEINLNVQQEGIK